MVARRSSTVLSEELAADAAARRAWRSRCGAAGMERLTATFAKPELDLNPGQQRWCVDRTMENEQYAFEAKLLHQSWLRQAA